MSLKNKFLAYVEYQRGAEEAYYREGPTSLNVKNMFVKANQMKREILDLMDEQENEYL